MISFLITICNPDEVHTWDANDTEETDFQLEGLHPDVVSAIRHLAKVAKHAEKEGFELELLFKY